MTDRAEPCGDCMKVRPHKCPRHESRPMTDRAEPGVTPLDRCPVCSEMHREWANMARHIIQRHTQAAHHHFRDARLDAAPPRPGLVERIADALETIGVVWPNYPGGQYEGSQRDRAERTIAAALASGTGEPGLDVTGGIHPDGDFDGLYANDKEADPTPEPDAG